MKGNEKERQLHMKSRLQSADVHNVLLDTFLVCTSCDLSFGLVFRYKGLLLQRVSVLRMAKKKKQVNVKQPESKPSNPFELHYNKIKRNAIGRRVEKGEVGKPTKSRDEAFKRRKNTLLQEYIHRNKSGKGVVDRRVKDETGGFAARKAKVFEIRMKENKDREELTHRGRILDNSIDDRPGSDREDEDMNLLSRAEYIESAHFGGGDGDHGRTQAEFMLEMIEEKEKRRKEKEENLVMTEKLDEELATLRSLIQAKGVPDDDALEAETKEEKSYDALLNELRFRPDRKAKTTNSRKIDGDKNEDEHDPRIVRKRKERELAEARRHIPAPKRKDFVILPMIEPKIEKKLRKQHEPMKKLKKQVKREQKGAQRELRKDNRFMKEVRMKEMREGDEERKRKVNRIIADLASDLHDFKKSKK